MTATSRLQEMLGYTFVRPELLQQSLTHKSFANEQEAAPGEANFGDNERFEFLGDAVLDLTLSAELMRRFPNDPEGGLSKKRASLVNEDTLASLAREMKLDELVRLGRGEQKTGGVTKPRILASCLEAVLGAIFIDGGYSAAVSATDKVFSQRLVDVATSSIDFHHDFKTRLQELVQELHRATPVYKIEAESGPDHDKKFAVSVRVADQILATGSGKSKKSAEQDAAREALEKLAENSSDVGAESEGQSDRQSGLEKRV